MNFRSLKLGGAYEITLAPRRDERGYFMRTYDDAIFSQAGLGRPWVQENEACSLRKATIRGLHFQRPPHSETKLVRVVEGEILDVLVDLRRSSPTFGRWDSVLVSAERCNAVYIPKGFAHGYCTMSARTVMLYKVDAVYAAEAEGGLRWDDEHLAIPWPATEPLVSAKDSHWPKWADLPAVFD